MNITMKLRRDAAAALADAARSGPSTDDGALAALIVEGIDAVDAAIEQADHNLAGAVYSRHRMQDTDEPSGAPPAVAPTRSHAGSEYDEYHPAYAMIGANRTSSGPPGTALFGSDFRHGSYMTLRIHAAELRRGLSYDRVHANELYIEVALSEAQWATMIATPGMGDGVPCTLQWQNGYSPRIAPITDRRAQLASEVDDHLRLARDKIDEVLSSAKLTRDQKFALEAAKSNMSRNLAFVAKSFDEHAEETVEKMKIEVEAYLTGAVHRAGITALGGGPLLELASGEEPE